MRTRSPLAPLGTGTSWWVQPTKSVSERRFRCLSRLQRGMSPLGAAIDMTGLEAELDVLEVAFEDLDEHEREIMISRLSEAGLLPDEPDTTDE